MGTSPAAANERHRQEAQRGVSQLLSLPLMVLRCTPSLGFVKVWSDGGGWIMQQRLSEERRGGRDNTGPATQTCLLSVRLWSCHTDMSVSLWSCHTDMSVVCKSVVLSQTCLLSVSLWSCHTDMSVVCKSVVLSHRHVCCLWSCHTDMSVVCKSVVLSHRHVCCL